MDRSQNQNNPGASASSASPPNPEPDRHTQMVSIGTHSLSVSLSGPDAHSDAEPIVVIFPGSGDVASSWVAVERLLRSSIRVLLYDRSGLGRSESGPVPDPSESGLESGTEAISVTAANELALLLDAAQISTRLILLAHSYGGIVAREFLHLYPDRVVGVVMVDASTERASEFFSIPDENIAAVLGGLNYARIVGLKQGTVLSDEEWRIRSGDIRKGFEGAKREMNGLKSVCLSLKEKGQIERRVLGDKPLGVIRANTAGDYERIYEAGVQAGNGTEHQRRAFRKQLDRWDSVDAEFQEEQLKLSSTTHFVRLPDCGHNVHLLRPDAIADEVKWVKEHLL